MKRIYITCHKGASATESSNQARRLCNEAVMQGLLPMCPQIYFPQFVSDSTREQAQRRIHELALYIMRLCDEVWYWPGEDATPTRALKEELTRAAMIGIPCTLKS